MRKEKDEDESFWMNDYDEKENSREYEKRQRNFQGENLKRTWFEKPDNFGKYDSPYGLWKNRYGYTEMQNKRDTWWKPEREHKKKEPYLELSDETSQKRKKDFGFISGAEINENLLLVAKREEKFVDITIGTLNSNVNGDIFPIPGLTLFQIQQGSDDNERIGFSVKLKDIEWWFRVYVTQQNNLYDKPSMTRLMLVRDKQNNPNVAPTVGNILQGPSDIDCYQKLENEKRFDILYDIKLKHDIKSTVPLIETTQTTTVVPPNLVFGNVHLTTQGWQCIRESHIVEGKFEAEENEWILFNTNNSNTFTSLTSKNYFFVFFGDHNGMKGKIEGKIRIKYEN